MSSMLRHCVAPTSSRCCKNSGGTIKIWESHHLLKSLSTAVSTCRSASSASSSCRFITALHQKTIMSPARSSSLPSMCWMGSNNRDFTSGGQMSRLNEFHYNISNTPFGGTSIATRCFATGNIPKKKKGGGYRQNQKRRNTKTKANRKASLLEDLGLQPHRTIGENGRPIMTEERLNEILLASATTDKSSSITTQMTKEMSNQAKGLLHNAQRKLLFHQTYEHSTEEGIGLEGMHEQLFFVTLRTTLDASCLNMMGGDVSLPSVVQDSFLTKEDVTTNNIIELVNTGSARSKKRAETLAATDLIHHLSQHPYNIDINNPPDLAKARNEKKEEQFKVEVQRAQMILEALNVSRPRFDSVEVSISGVGNGWVSTLTMYCRGVPITASNEHDPAQNKSQSEGMALLEATAPNGTLEYFVGQKKMNEVRNLIQSSPAGHVAALHVPELPEEVLDDLVSVMGSNVEYEERMAEHAAAKRRYEQDFFERRRRSSDGRGGGAKGGGFRSLLANGEEGANGANETFVKEEQARVEKALSDPDGKQGRMQSIRDALPIKAIREDLIEALKDRQVVVVSGGTGSGKSTQCPQYILEDAIANKRGADTRIVVTQPRRIAAISVAERIADERDEAIGNSVGYTVRFNKRSPREAGASIEFVTTGVLLRRLVNDPSLEGVSHVMIDEVHERDIDTDFLLVLLRDLLAKRPELRVILMSATLDAESFGEYFSSSGDGSAPVPVMSVPTKPRHPVEVIHLEEMAGEGGKEHSSLSAFDTKVQSEIKDLAQSLLRLHDQQLQLELEEAVAEDSAALRLEARSLAEDEGNISLEDDEESSGSESDDSDDDSEANTSHQLAPSTRLKALRRAASMRGVSNNNRAPQSSSPSDKREIGEITTKLLAKLAQHVAQVETDAGRKGSILCFLPGLDEIKEAMSILETESNPALKQRMKILPLHSTIPQDEQQKVFVSAEDGTVKVILATNIAESSVTIDDVLAVVDGGLVRELSWSAEKAMSQMETVQVSKASATQRLGRAGRVAPGKCYRIYSRGQHMAMLERPMPEIQRTALEATCLNTCTLTNDSVETFLSRAMDPPKAEAVSHSMERLKKLGAVSVDTSLSAALTEAGGSESLTPLGQCLSHLPLDPAIGRMLIMGVVMQCLDPVLTAAACSSSRNLFFAPLGLRENARSKRQAFSEHSDMMAEVQAYNEFQRILDEDGWNVARQWASNNFFSIHAFNSVRSVRSQLISELQRIGLVHHTDLERSRGRQKEFHPDAPVNINSGNEALYTAVWATGNPDNLAARRQLGNFGTLRSRTENHAGLHPSSVCFHRKPPKKGGHALPPWFFYREMVLSSQVFLRGCTALKPEQVLLFGGYGLEKNNDDESKRVQRVLDDWIIVEGRCNDTLDILSRARSEIDVALDLKVMYPKRSLPESQQSIIDAISDCFDMMNDE